jgi:uncharacterized protein YecE (DUF72 family)
MTIITVGCAGFPVPATRYFREFAFVEVQETHIALPGPGTMRRWRREAPEGFQFALLGPREVGQEGFRDGKVVETALKMLTGVAKELDAATAVFVAPPEFAPTRANKGIVSEFLTAVRRKFERVIFEPAPGWDPDECDAIASAAQAMAARDPLAHGLSKAPRGTSRATKIPPSSGSPTWREKANTRKRRTCSPTSTCLPTPSASRRR